MRRCDGAPLIRPPADRRRVALATTIGTTIEWYDFFIYASAAGLVFAQLYFRPAGDQIALLLSFASVGVSFLFRPLGAFLAGHLGDLIGRKSMLVVTLILMGGATTAIGLLPTYDSAGLLAPICLLILRILQGLSAGGEWGGAVLMAVEHAPEGRRGRFGAFPQLGLPLGLLAASGHVRPDGRDRPGRGVRRVGLAGAVPDQCGADRGRDRRPEPGRGEPGLHGPGPAPAADHDPDRPVVPVPHADRDLGRAHLRRQQRGRLHDDRRLPRRTMRPTRPGRWRWSGRRCCSR